MKTAEEYHSLLGSLLNHCGKPGLCQGCGASIWWLVNKNGRWAPYTRDGLNHFADCPRAEAFRKAQA